MKNCAFVFALVGSSVFSGLFVIFKTAEEQAYQFGKVDSLNDAKEWNIDKLDYSVFTNGTCTLDYFRLSLDPWHCFTPYLDFPLSQNCSLIDNNPEAVFPYYRENLAFQAAVGLFIFFGLFVAAYQPKARQFEKPSARILHQVLTLIYTFSVGIGFAIYELFSNNPRAADLGRCKTLLDVTQAACQLITPVKPSFFTPACIEGSKWNGNYPVNVTLSDLNSITVNTTEAAIAEPDWMYVLSYLNVELLTCSIISIFALMIHSILQKNNVCFGEERRRPRLQREITDDNDVLVHYDETSPLILNN